MSNFLGENDVEVNLLVNVHIYIGHARHNSLRAPQESLKKDQKVVETLPWLCQSTEQNDAPFVNKQPVNGEFIDGNLTCLRIKVVAKPQAQTMACSRVRRLTYWVSFLPVDGGLLLLPSNNFI